MSVELSGEVTAVATAALTVLAIVTSVFAILAFRKQSQDVHDQASMLGVQQRQLDEQRMINGQQTKVLELQVTELRESIDDRIREGEQRRRSQATRVFVEMRGSPEEGVVRVPYVRNASDLPIYAVQLWNRDTRLNWDILGAIMPGEQSGGHGLARQSSSALKLSDVILTFGDAAGVNWIRMPDGALSEQSRATPYDSVKAVLNPDLPTHYERLDDQITYSVLDAIVVYPRSHGELRLSDEYKQNGPPAHYVSFTSEDGSIQGVYASGRNTDGQERFTVIYDVWNQRDCRIQARIILTQI